MMKYWQLTKENGREMLDRLQSYKERGYIWEVMVRSTGNEIQGFSIVFHCDFSVSKEDQCSPLYVDRCGEKFHIGDYLVFKDANLFIATAEEFKRLAEEYEEETGEKVIEKDQSQEATEHQKKVLIEQLAEAYEKHEYTRSTVLHRELMEMGMTENEIMGKVNELLCAKLKVGKDENEPDECKDNTVEYQQSLLKEMIETYKRITRCYGEFMKTVGLTAEEINAKFSAMCEGKDEIKEVDIKTSSILPIDELQKILVRRSQLQKELAEIEKTLTKNYEIKVIDTENK